MGSTGVPVGPTVILRYTCDVCASNWGVTAIEIGPTVTILNNVLIVLIFLTSILLTLTILMHKGQGGGLSDMFGGGISSSAGSSGVAERNLNRITMGTLFIWLVCIVGYALLAKYGRSSRGEPVSFVLNAASRVSSRTRFLLPFLLVYSRCGIRPIQFVTEAGSQ